MTTSTQAITLLGATSVNFLTNDDYLFEASEGTWTGTNASLTVERTRLFKTYQSLRVQPLALGSPSTSVQLDHQAQVVGSEYVDDAIVATVFVYAYAPINVAIRVNSNVPSETTYAFTSVPSLTWTLIRSEPLAVPSNVLNKTYSMTIFFESFGGLQHFHIAHPALTNYYGFTQNQFLRETTLYMPRVLNEIDSEQSRPSFPMNRMMDIGLAYAGRGALQAERFRYRDISQGYKDADDSTKSTLVDPDVAEARYLPWLAQFVGMRLPLIVGGSTPWGNLPETWEQVMEDIDPVADVTYSISSISRDGSGVVAATLTASPTDLAIGDTVSVRDTALLDGQFVLTDVDTGSNTIEWAEDGSATSDSTGSVTLVDTSWAEIESFNTSDSDFVPRRRALINQARIGHRAGTTGALEDAAKVNLSGTKTVNIIIEPELYPWTITVQTLTSETPNGIVGESAIDVQTELNKVRPMGYQIVHECVDSL